MEKNITEELIRFLMNQVKDLQRENAELKSEHSSRNIFCDCYHDGYCWGTAETEKCSCRGIKKYCDFY
jgi:hypothetical protein